ETIGHAGRLFNNAAGFRDGVLNQASEANDTALAGLERLAVLAVDRAEADMLEMALGRNAAAFAGGAEHLLEMQALARIDNIENAVGIMLIAAHLDGRKIGGAIHDRAVGFFKNKR